MLRATSTTMTAITVTLTPMPERGVRLDVTGQLAANTPQARLARGMVAYAAAMHIDGQSATCGLHINQPIQPEPSQP